MSSCRHDCSSRQTDSNTLHIPPSRGKRLISNGVARQLVSACGECEVGSTCAQLVWQAFPGSYGWESGNRLASGWSPSPPNSPLSPFPGLWHQLPAKQKDKELRQKKMQKIKRKKCNWEKGRNSEWNLMVYASKNWLGKSWKSPDSGTAPTHPGWTPRYTGIASCTTHQDLFFLWKNFHSKWVGGKFYV